MEACMAGIFQAGKKTGRKPVLKKVVKGQEGKISITPEMIAKKAYELYEKRGCKPGNAQQDWLEAKKILEAGE